MSFGDEVAEHLDNKTNQLNVIYQAFNELGNEIQNSIQRTAPFAEVIGEVSPEQLKMNIQGNDIIIPMKELEQLIDLKTATKEGIKQNLELLIRKKLGMTK